MLLEVRNISVYYGSVQALNGVNIEVAEGEIVAVLGSNGAGKSTLLRAVSGLVRPREGAILLRDEPIHALSPQKIVQSGIAHVPEGRRVFPRSTTWDNLLVGAYSRSDRQQIHADAEAMMERFPVLRRRRQELAKMLSGGEQQMLAIARGLMANPQLLLLDEPSLGLAPLLVDEIFRIIEGLRQRGVSILLVEQNATRALRVADHAYVLVTGTVALHGLGRELLDDQSVRKLYLGEV